MTAHLSPALLARIETAGIDASTTTQQAWVDGWLVRTCPGKAKRSRCVNPVGTGSSTLEERLATCAELYARARLPLIVRLTPFSQPPGLDAWLAQLGMQRFDETRVMVLADLQASDASAPSETGDLSFEHIGPEAMAERIGGFRGSSEGQRRAHAERLRESSVRHVAFEARMSGEAVACAQYVRDGDLVGLYDVHTVAAVRGRGVAGALCRHLLTQAKSEGALHAYLQVEASNAPAQALYGRLGFVHGYPYHYRCHDPHSA